MAKQVVSTLLAVVVASTSFALVFQDPSTRRPSVNTSLLVLLAFAVLLDQHE